MSYKKLSEDLDRLYQMHYYERKLWEKEIKLVAGLDEAGRGPLAGPVVAAAVILRKELLITGLKDSKCVSEEERPLLAEKIKTCAAGWGIGIAPVGYIERCNILQATFYAMIQALRRAGLRPDHVLVDGHMEVPDLGIPQTTIVKGDQKSAAVAAASILAKTTRDAIMRYYHSLYPRYGFNRNKGYPTAEHLAAIKRYGPCFLHRKTFRGVKENLRDDYRFSSFGFKSKRNPGD
ncbi:MAG TPA: ribonuclease HII [Syntrophaceticus sp.]|nr:ribonuclease HII [Syntrophaceticus sp.]